MEQSEYVACCGSLKRYAACRTMQSISLNPGTRASSYAGCAQVLYIKLLDTGFIFPPSPFRGKYYIST